MSAKRKLDLDRTRERLVALGLTHAAESLDGVLTEAVKDDASPHLAIDALLEAEISIREARRVKTGLRLSSLPTGQTLAEFDFAFQPSVERSKIDLLATCAWVRQAETLLIQGPPGVGKTHLAVGLGMKAIESGFGVQLNSNPPHHQKNKKDTGQPTARHHPTNNRTSSHQNNDEHGFEPMDRQEASLFFRLVTYRYGRGSILITTNKSVREWPELLAGDEVLSTAILDRLLHKAHVLNIKGRSYRLRDLEHALSQTVA